MEVLKPYKGKYAGNHHYVVDEDTGDVLRNATPLEVQFHKQIQQMKEHRNLLLSALEAQERFWAIRESELGFLSDEATALRNRSLDVIGIVRGQNED